MQYVIDIIQHFQTILFWVASPLGWLALELYIWLFERHVPVKKEWGE